MTPTRCIICGVKEYISPGPSDFICSVCARHIVERQKREEAELLRAAAESREFHNLHLVPALDDHIGADPGGPSSGLSRRDCEPTALQCEARESASDDKRPIPGTLAARCNPFPAAKPPSNAPSGAALNAGPGSRDSLFPQSEQLPRVSEHWCLSRDGDPYGYDLMQRHYSARRYREQRQRLFVGPGRKLVLLSGDGSALFVWRDFICDIQPPQEGYNCAVFRNEGQTLSSLLVREAVAVVFERWGHSRCWTLVNPRKIRSANPGCCFIKAGWRRCGVSKTGKVILFFLPETSGRNMTSEHGNTL